MRDFCISCNIKNVGARYDEFMENDPINGDTIFKLMHQLSAGHIKTHKRQRDLIRTKGFFMLFHNTPTLKKTIHIKSNVFRVEHGQALLHDHPVFKNLCDQSLPVNKELEGELLAPLSSSYVVICTLTNVSRQKVVTHFV